MTREQGLQHYTPHGHCAYAVYPDPHGTRVSLYDDVDPRAISCAGEPDGTSAVTHDGKLAARESDRNV